MQVSKSENNCYKNSNMLAINVNYIFSSNEKEQYACFIRKHVIEDIIHKHAIYIIENNSTQNLEIINYNLE